LKNYSLILEEIILEKSPLGIDLVAIKRNIELLTSKEILSIKLVQLKG
jgi:hypothetical protein